LSLQAVEAADLDRAVTGMAKITCKVDDVERLVRTGVLDALGATASLDLGPLAVRELRAGHEVAVMARVGDSAPDVVRLQPTVASVPIDGAELDAVIAAREIDAGGESRMLPGERTLGDLALHGEAVAPTWRDGRVNELAKVTVAAGTLPATRPTADRIGIRDVIEFLAAPIVPTTDGGSAVVPLDAADVRGLLQGEPVTTSVADRDVTLYPLGFKPAEPGVMEISRAYLFDPRYTRYDLGRLRRELYPVGTVTVDGGAVNDDPKAKQPRSSSRDDRPANRSWRGSPDP
jgi:hypothetical protein